jgi:hypothetical protein
MTTYRGIQNGESSFLCFKMCSANFHCLALKPSPLYLHEKRKSWEATEIESKPETDWNTIGSIEPTQCESLF